MWSFPVWMTDIIDQFGQLIYTLRNLYYLIVWLINDRVERLQCKNSLVIITWLADSCRNRMLRHCPTDDRIIGGKKKGEWSLFLWEFKLLWWILCSSQSMCDICNSQFCGQQPNYALTSALLQRNTEKLSSLSLQSSYKCLDWAQ